MGRKVLITGAAGFVGNNLTRHLLAESSYDTLAVDKLTYAGNRASLTDVEDSARFMFLHADICDRRAMQRAFAEHKPVAVMHLAAESHVDRSIDGPAEFIQTNVVGTYTLLKAACDYWRQLPSEVQPAFRFLHVSTDEVYGSLGPNDAPFSETSPYDPHSPYSATKAASDHLARAWHVTYGLPVIVTNCSNNYGPYQFPEKLIPVVIASALEQRPIPVYGEGKNVRDWLYVGDHAAALACVLEKGKPGETYNIGGDSERTNIDLVEMICALLDEMKPRADGSSYRNQITFVADRPGHDLRYAIDATKIREELGWSPQQDHESGLRKTVAWYLKNEAWWRGILTGSYRLERQGLGVR